MQLALEVYLQTSSRKISSFPVSCWATWNHAKGWKQHPRLALSLSHSLSLSLQCASVVLRAHVPLQSLVLCACCRIEASPDHGARGRTTISSWKRSDARALKMITLKYIPEFRGQPSRRTPTMKILPPVCKDAPETAPGDGRDLNDTEDVQVRKVCANLRNCHC